MSPERAPVSQHAVEHERRGRLQADLALLLITAFWGVTFVVVKDALGHADPFTFLALRFATGALLLSLLAGRQVLQPQALRAGGLLAVFLFLGFALQTVGLTSTTASRSAFITGLSVVGVPFVSLVFFRRVPRLPSLVGVVLAVAGLWALTRPDAAGAGGGLTRGDLLTVGCAVAYAFHIAFTEKLAPKQGVMGMVAVQLWGVALLSALCVPLQPGGPRVEWTGSFVMGFLFCGVFASAVAISVQTWGQARTSAVRAALIYSLEPVFAAAYSVLLGYERLGAREALGGGLIMLGVLVAELGAHLLDRFRPGMGERREDAV
ncbi:DMT family transporter [Simulacricoccus sp. 17bor-14]|nr:DMT family transporter [Simulacricoccus sp. 17bor-14]